jgi:pimeloyl-ACP methyl ester carboxylesterase
VISIAAQAFIEAQTLAAIRAAKVQFADAKQLERLRRYHGDNAPWVLDAWTEVWLAPAFSTWSVRPWLAGVRCPVCVIHGERDEFGSVAFPEAIAAGIGGPAKLHLLPGLGHLPHREAPETVLAIVERFLAVQAVTYP